MPIIKSAKKRVRVANKAAVRNSKTKRAMKSALKDLAKSPSVKTLTEVQSKVDTAAKKNVIHKNKAARLKSRAAKQAKANGIKLSKGTTSKKASTKPVAKKTTSAKASKTAAPKKASPAKAKKTPAKKPSASSKSK